jgi:hypothetical protein
MRPPTPFVAVAEAQSLQKTTGVLVREEGARLIVVVG